MEYGNKRIRDAKQMVGHLNSIWWDQYITKKVRKGLEDVWWRV
jgi:hypothetical protein